MNLMLLGIGVGLLTLIPPGPVSLTLVQVGARLGHRPALRGALGVATGDCLLAAAAIMIVGAGSALPPALFIASQAMAAGILILLGVLLLSRPDAAARSVDRISRPGRALFVITSLTPSALGSWIALLAAMPFAQDRYELVLFAIGVVVASFLWHPALGALASTLGARLNAAGQARLSRLGGAAMVALGVLLAGSQLL